MIPNIGFLNGKECKERVNFLKIGIIGIILWRINRLEFWWNNPAMMLDATIPGTYWVTTDCRKKLQNKYIYCMNIFSLP